MSVIIVVLKLAAVCVSVEAAECRRQVDFNDLFYQLFTRTASGDQIFYSNQLYTVALGEGN